jgi:hypothetical protein
MVRESHRMAVAPVGQDSCAYTAANIAIRIANPTVVDLRSLDRRVNGPRLESGRAPKL